jgi:hypothetical protein
MNEDQWQREYAAQTAYLAAQLQALSRRPIQRRKAFIDHEIRCTGCGDPIVQVISLDPYRVVRYRGVKPDLEEYPPDMEPAARAIAMSRRSRSIRLEQDWQFFPIAEGEGDADNHLVQAACRCTQQHTMTLGGILRRDGKRSTARPTRR